MVSGHVREMYARDQRRVKLEYGKRIWSEVFDLNPKIARYEETGDFQLYRARVEGLRPYIKAKTQTRWSWGEYSPPIGEIFLSREEIEWAARLNPFVVVEPNHKPNASPNKDWGWGRWQALVRLMGAAGLRATQLGPAGTKRMPGTEFIETPTFRHAVAALERARAAVLPEGGLHHAAAAVGVSAVVIYGGYISPKQTGYAMHTNLFTGGHPCGMRIPCNHCADAMTKITPGDVLASLRGLL